MQEAFVAANDRKTKEQIDGAKSLGDRLIILGQAWVVSREGDFVVNSIRYLREEGQKSRDLLALEERDRRNRDLESLAQGIGVRDSRAPGFEVVRTISLNSRRFIDPIIEYNLGMAYFTAGAAVLTIALVDLTMLDPSKEADLFRNTAIPNVGTPRVTDVIRAYTDLLG